MIQQPITEDNFLLIAMNAYDNSQCTSIAEFEEDLKRFSYLKKLFSRYNENGDLKERLILNHIIVLHNIFGVVTIELLFFKIDKQYWNTLASFLVYLGLMPQEIPEFNIKLDEMNIDKRVTSALGNI